MTEHSKSFLEIVERYWRMMVTGVGVLLLVVFWSFPLAFALSFANLDRLRHVRYFSKVLNPVLDALGPVILSVVQVKWCCLLRAAK